jgi:exodeoxyribonuclease VII small subunit
MPKAVPPARPPSFEAALEELENIVRTMETGQLPLEAQLTSYQRGVELLRRCQEALAHAEQKIQVLEAGALRDFSPGDDPSPGD